VSIEYNENADNMNKDGSCDSQIRHERHRIWFPAKRELNKNDEGEKQEMKGAIEILQKEMIQNGDAPVTKEGYIPFGGSSESGKES